MSDTYRYFVLRHKYVRDRYYHHPTGGLVNPDDGRFYEKHQVGAYTRIKDAEEVLRNSRIPDLEITEIEGREIDAFDVWKDLRPFGGARQTGLFEDT